VWQHKDSEHERDVCGNTRILNMNVVCGNTGILNMNVVCGITGILNMNVMCVAAQGF
jgi:hypothetical protein